MIAQAVIQLWRILEVEPMLSAKTVMMDALLIYASESVAVGIRR